MFTESNITMAFPDEKYFRFSECKGYKDIQENFKEMDICWYHSEENTLHIFELKDWGDCVSLEEDKISGYDQEKLKAMKEGISKHRIQELFKKSLDSVAMFLSVLLGKPYAKHIQICAPFVINHETKIKLISIINTENKAYIDLINTKYRMLFKPYAKLFGIHAYLVMTKEQATEHFKWIS